MKVGITGSTGVMGTILKEKLLSKGFEITAFKGDVRSKNDIKKWLKSENFDTLFHLVAIVPTIQEKDNSLKAFSVNVDGTINLLEVLNDLDQNIWFFYASTSHVYKSKNTPIN